MSGLKTGLMRLEGRLRAAGLDRREQERVARYREALNNQLTKRLCEDAEFVTAMRQLMERFESYPGDPPTDYRAPARVAKFGERARRMSWLFVKDAEFFDLAAKVLLRRRYFEEMFESRLAKM